MKFKKTREASIIKKKVGGGARNFTLQMFLEACAQKINEEPTPFPNEVWFIWGINELLNEIVGSNNMYIYYNKLYNTITKYDESAYKELVRLIDDELNKFKLLDNNFYEWFTLKLKNYSEEFNLELAYKILLYINTFRVAIDFLDLIQEGKKMKFKNNNQAKLIIKNFADNGIKNITVRKYLNYCVDTINKLDNPNASLEEFEEILEEILGEEFLKKRSVDKMFTLNEKLLNFVVETIRIELDKLNALDNKFYKYYTAKLNNHYNRHYIYYRYCSHENRDYSDINQAYAILKQLVEFKKVIDFEER